MSEPTEGTRSAAERMGPAIVAVSTWWAQQIENPTFNIEAPGRVSQGDVAGFKVAMQLHPGHSLIDSLQAVASGLPQDKEHRGAILTQGLASMLADQNPVEAADIKRFRDVMIERLVHRYEENPSVLERETTWGFHMEVDYHPDQFLASVAEQAGVSISRFPYKTRTKMTEHYVTVGLGYGAEQRAWWKEEGYYIGKCASQKYATSQPNGGKLLYLPYKCGLERYHHGEHAFTDILPLCKHCNRPEQEQTLHTGTYGAPPDHAFEAGQADICTKCWEARVVAPYVRERHAQSCWKLDRSKGQYGEWVQDGEHDFRPHPDLVVPVEPDIVVG